MNIKSIQTKLKLLILSALCVSALSLPAFANHLEVDGYDYPSETGKTYDSEGEYEIALTVLNNGSYTGTNITLNSTHIAAADVDQSRLKLTGGSVTAIGNNVYGIRLDNGSFTGNNLNIETTGQYSYGVYATNSSTLTLTDGSINVAAGVGGGLYLEYGTATATLDNSTVGGSIQLWDSGLVLSASNGSVINGGVSGQNSTANITLSGEETKLNGNVSFEGNYGAEALALDVSDGSVITGNVIANYMGLTLNLSGEGAKIDGSVYNDGYQDLTLTLNDSVITGNVTYNTYGGNFLLNASNDSVIGSGVDNTLDITGASATVTLDNSTMNSDIQVSDSSLVLSASNGSIINGDVMDSGNYDSSSINITLTGEGTELHGDFSQAGDDSIINLSLDEGALLVGGGELDGLTLGNGVTIGYTGTTITVTESITIDGTVTIDLSDLASTGDYDVLDWSEAKNVDVAKANFNFIGAGVEGSFDIENGQLVFNATAVPEPSTWFLLGTGLGILLLTVRQHRRHNTRS
jgi:hypothetical protein